MFWRLGKVEKEENRGKQMQCGDVDVEEKLEWKTISKIGGQFLVFRVLFEIGCSQEGGGRNVGRWMLKNSAGAVLFKK